MDIRTALSVLEPRRPKTNLLRELTGYKQSGVIPAFKDALADIGPGYHPKEVRYEKLQKFLSLMEEKGFETISNGSFGAVFSLPGLDYVVKIFKDDTAYLSFLKYVEQNASNPSLPCLRGKLISLGEGHFAVRIEKLKPVQDNVIRRGLCEVFNKIFKIGLPCDDLQDFYDHADYTIKQPFVARGVKAIVREDPGLLYTLKDLTENHLGNHELDIYPGNFMMRGRKNVIIDPFADLSKLISSEDQEFFNMIGDIVKMGFK